MFSKKLMEVCEQTTIAHVEQLFERNRTQPGLVKTIPYIGNLYRTDGEKDVAWLKQRVVAALLTRRWFDMTKPPWAGELPLSFADINAAERSDCPRCKRVGYFGDSVRGQGWAWKLHPPFATYCSGLLACGYAPKELQEPSLRVEFPPQKLAGLADGYTGWRTDEEIAEDRAYAAWIYETQRRFDTGKEVMPFVEWKRKQLSMYVGCC